jgi:hypothetical protein
MVNCSETSIIGRPNQDHPGFIQHSHVVAQGFSPTLIRRFLGEADRIETSRAGNCLQRLYRCDRVQQVFATPEAQSALRESARRRTLIRKTRKSNEGGVLKQIDQLSISVQNINAATLRLQSYRWLKHHLTQCSNAKLPGVDFLSERHLARREYLFARHRLCGFEACVGLISGMAPIIAYQRRLVTVFNQQILACYPQMTWPAQQAEQEPIVACVALAVIERQTPHGVLDFNACQSASC